MIPETKIPQLITPHCSFSPRCLLLAPCLCFLLIFSGCFSDEGDGNNMDGNATSGPTTEDSTITDASGTASMSFEVSPGTNKLSVTAQSPADFMRISSLHNESGTDWVNVEGGPVSDATSLAPVLSTANAPSRAADPALAEGTYTVVASAADSSSGFGSSPSAGTSVIFTINSKDDADLNSGSLAVNIFYVGEVGQDPKVKSATSSAVSVMRSIYSSQASIGVNVREFDIDGPTLLPLPYLGDSLYLSTSSLGPSPAINIVIGGDLSEFDGTVYGMASAIPGPPIPSVKSAVAVSAVAAAGPDGDFSDNDIRILGETLAHESGHYMGLYHPIELDFSSGSVLDTDPLGDTPTCGSGSECLSNDSLVSNLMFPTPVGDTAQDQLSSEQAGVMNRYIVVD